jgi:hypothetical protein
MSCNVRMCVYVYIIYIYICMYACACESMYVLHNMLFYAAYVAILRYICFGIYLYTWFLSFYAQHPAAVTKSRVRHFLNVSLNGMGAPK